jgi:phosphoglycolate phosphatase-like HAD superfamily hydrolase
MAITVGDLVANLNLNVVGIESSLRAMTDLHESAVRLSTSMAGVALTGNLAETIGKLNTQLSALKVPIPDFDNAGTVAALDAHRDIILGKYNGIQGGIIAKISSRNSALRTEYENGLTVTQNYVDKLNAILAKANNAGQTTTSSSSVSSVSSEMAVETARVLKAAEDRIRRLSELSRNGTSVLSTEHATAESVRTADGLARAIDAVNKKAEIELRGLERQKQQAADTQVNLAAINVKRVEDEKKVVDQIVLANKPLTDSRLIKVPTIPTKPWGWENSAVSLPPKSAGTETGGSSGLNTLGEALDRVKAGAEKVKASVDAATKSTVDLGVAATATAASETKLATSTTATVSSEEKLVSSGKRAEATLNTLATAVGGASEKIKGIGASLGVSEEKLSAFANYASSTSSSLSRLSSGLSLVNAHFGQAFSRVQTLSYATEGLSGGWQVAASGAILLGSAIASLGGHAITVAKSLDGAEAELKAYGASFNDVANLSLKYGTNISQIAKPYGQLRESIVAATGSTEDFVRISDDLSAFGAKFSLTSDTVGTLMKTVRDFYQEGIVSFDGLTKQLGEKLPSAAKAILPAFNEMVAASGRMGETGPIRDYVVALEQAKKSAYELALASGKSSDEAAIASKRAGLGVKEFNSAVEAGLVTSIKYTPVYMAQYREMMNVGADGGNNMKTSLDRLNAAKELFIRRVDQSIGITTGWNKVVELAASTLTSLSTAITSSPFGTLASYALSATAGITALGGAMAVARAVGVSWFSTLVVGGATIAALAARMGLLGLAVTGVAVALSLATADSAKAATSTVETTVKNVEDATNRMRTSTSVSASTDLQIVAAGAAQEIKLLEATSTKLQSEIDSIRKEQATRRMQFSRTMDDPSATFDSLRTNVAEEKLQSLSKSYGLVTDGIDKLRIAVAAANKELPSDALGTKVENTAEKVRVATEKEVAELRLYMTEVQTLGAEAADLNRAVRAKVASSVAAGVPQGAAEDMKPQFEAIERLRVATTKLTATKRESAGTSYLGKKDDPETIIRYSEMIVEGVGIKQANAFKKAELDINKYREALIATGNSELEVAAKVNQLTQAFSLQEKGINTAALQFRPYVAVQRGMEGLADSIADSASKGDLSLKSLSASFSRATQSIIKDLIAMMLKAAIVKPLMESMGLMGGGGMGSVASSAGSGMGGINPFAWAGSVQANAVGDVVDQPAHFMGGGSAGGSGGVGVMGEAGPEAIIPLSRGPGGRLGVSMMDGSANKKSGNDQDRRLGGEITVTINPSSEFHATLVSTVEGTVAKTSPQVVAASVDATKRALPGMIGSAQKRSL